MGHRERKAVVIEQETGTLMLLADRHMLATETTLLLIHYIAFSYCPRQYSLFMYFGDTSVLLSMICFLLIFFKYTKAEATSLAAQQQPPISSYVHMCRIFAGVAHYNSISFMLLMSSVVSPRHDPFASLTMNNGPRLCKR